MVIIAGAPQSPQSSLHTTTQCSVNHTRNDAESFVFAFRVRCVHGITYRRIHNVVNVQACYAITQTPEKGRCDERECLQHEDE
jgi:hypothetical protein